MMNMDFLINEIAAVKFLQDISGFGPVKFRGVYEEFRSFVQFIDYVDDSRKYPLRSSRIAHIRKILGEKILEKLFNKLESEGACDLLKEFASKQLRMAKKQNMTWRAMRNRAR